MKRRFLPVSMLVITFGLILLGSSSVVLSTDFSAADKGILNANSEWRMLVDGGVKRPINLTFDELVAMPRSTVFADLVCPGFFVISANWTGVRLGLVLEKAGFDPNELSNAESDSNTTIVRFLAEDGYEVGVSLTDAIREDVIIAYEKNGAPLPEKTRLVIPGELGGKWISNITQIVAVPASIPEFSNMMVKPISTTWILAASAIILVVISTITIHIIRKRKQQSRYLSSTFEETY